MSVSGGHCCCSVLRGGIWTQSRITRLVHLVLLIIASIFCFILISPKGRIILGEGRCTKKNYHICESFFGYSAVYRLCTGIAAFHMILALLTYGVKSSTVKRAAIQNQFWFVKFPFLIAIIIAMLFIPKNDYTGELWFFLGLNGAVGFLVLQYVFLAKLADDWAKWLDEKATFSLLWKIIFNGITVLLYLFCATAHVCLYVFYTTAADCTDNKFFITFHIYLCVGASIISRHPKVREVRPRSGLFQTSLILTFSTYTLWLVQSNEPDLTCNPHQRYRNSFRPHYNVVNTQRIASFIVATVILVCTVLRDNQAPQYGKVVKSRGVAKGSSLGMVKECVNNEKNPESGKESTLGTNKDQRDQDEQKNLEYGIKDEMESEKFENEETRYVASNNDSLKHKNDQKTSKELLKENSQSERDPDKETADISSEYSLTPCEERDSVKPCEERDSMKPCEERDSMKPCEERDSLTSCEEKNTLGDVSSKDTDHIMDIDNEDIDQPKECCCDDEVEGVEYSYTFFHIVFILYIFFIMMTASNWYHSEEHHVTAKLTSSWGPVWIRLSTLILCDLFYMYKMIVPVVLPHSYDRMLFYHYFFK